MVDPSRETFCVTTAINYANGLPHMGHAYEAVAADVLARYHRAYGRRVLFLTGADEHGQKIAGTAERKGVSPKQLCDEYVSKFQELNARLGVSNDVYVRTTSEEHHACCQRIFQKSQEAGDIYLGSYEGWYNVREETFVTETEAAGTEYKDPVSGAPLEKMLESSFFFRQSKYQERLVAFLLANPDFIRPEAQRNAILSRLQREPLLDLSISRTTFSWGIPVPEDPKHVMYVWFDALTNYLTGCQYPEGERSEFWPASVHIIGKDITWFHCVIWPCMLWSAGVPLPQRVFAHGFVTAADGVKMSKSIGNVVDPIDVLGRCSADSFRYYLLRGVFGSDVPYSEDALAMMHNADLADTLGNLLHRAANLTMRFCEGAVPDVPAEVVFDVALLRRETEAAFSSLAIHAACELAINAVKDTNKFLTDAAPWNLKDDTRRKMVIVRSTLEAVYLAAHFLAPFIPATAAVIFQRLGTPPRPLWALSGDFNQLVIGTAVQSGDILFTKFELAKPAEAPAPALRKPVAPAADAPVDVSRLDIRVGVVLSVERHPAAENLYVETIDLGDASGPRTVVSGLVKFIAAESLQGARVVCLCNLKPAAMRGVVSQAMVLCASDAEHTRVELVVPPEGAVAGERVVCADFVGQPDEQLNPKKKVWEAVQPDLRTTGACVAAFRGVPLTTSAGACRAASLADAVIK